MLHKVSKKDWDPMTWVYPRIHNYDFIFGLTADGATKASTMVPLPFQDNALVDLETVKTNPENADFAITVAPNCYAGSYVPKIQYGWKAYIPEADTEISHLSFDTMMIHTSMLNRLDAFDKKTGHTTESILELQHETTDEQCGALYNGTKLFEGDYLQDISTIVPFLTTDGQLEGVDFDKELFFDAMQYYTNKEMIKSMTDRMRTHWLSDKALPHGRDLVQETRTMNTPPMCKFMNPYDYCGLLFSVPQVGSKWQTHIATETTAIEHVRVKGWVRFYEYNTDFNFARA